MKKFPLLLFLSVSAFGSNPTVTPSTPTVTVGQSVVLTSTYTVNWSLVSGSTGTLVVYKSSAVYTAPLGISAKNSILGTQLLPNDHIYNTMASAFPTQTDSSTYVQNNLSGVSFGFEPSFGTNLYNNKTSTQTLTLNFTPQNNGVYRIGDISSVQDENGFYSDIRLSDHHILTVNPYTTTPSSDTFQEIYQLTSTGVLSCASCNADSAVKYGDNYTLNNGVDAAGMYLIPLSLRYSELHACIMNGTPIQHALRMTLSVGFLSNGGFVWPATLAATDGGALPFGARLVMLSTFTTQGSVGAKCIEQATKDYGMFIVDGGNNGKIQTMMDSISDWQTFQAIQVEMFANASAWGWGFANTRVVDEHLAKDTDTVHSYEAGSGAVNTSNPYVTPSNFAVVRASDTTGIYTDVRLVIQPVTIGVSQPNGYNMMAGAPQRYMAPIVQGSTNTSVTCSISPQVGTTTVQGWYTPPASVAFMSSTTMTCSNNADSLNVVYSSFPINVFSSSTVKERYANDINTNYVDVSGSTWTISQADLWKMQGHAYCDFSGDPWTGVTDKQLYQYCQYTSAGGDFWKHYWVQNGTYTLNFRFGLGGASGVINNGPWGEAIDYEGQNFNVYPATVSLAGGAGIWSELGYQGNYFLLCSIFAGCQFQSTATVTIPNVSVTNNDLWWAIRNIAINGGSAYKNVINATQADLVSVAAPDPTPTLSETDVGVGTSEVVTVTASSSKGNIFKLQWRAEDNWGLSDWYDLVNDTAGLTNLALAYSVQGVSNLCSRESGMAQVTFYGLSDKKASIYYAGCNFPNATRSMSIIANTPGEVEIQTSGHPTENNVIDSNTVVTSTYYILPTGKIYVHQVISVTNAVDLTQGGTTSNFVIFMGLNDPAQTGTLPPDSGVGWIRASTKQNPFTNFNGTETYTYAYWDQTTPNYSTFTVANIMFVPSSSTQNILADELQHSWGCGTGCGTVRWGYNTLTSASGPWNMGANSSNTLDYLIQLGTQNSTVLPNITSSVVADPIAAAYLANPTPPVPAPTVFPSITIQGGTTILGGATIP